MPGSPFVSPRVQFFTAAGAVLAAGTVDVYVPGTTTRRDSFSDYNIATPNANPVVLDSAGRAVIYLNPELSYKFVVKDSSGSTIYTEDNVPGSVFGHTVAATQTWIGPIRYGSVASENSLGGSILAGAFLRITGAYAPPSSFGGATLSLLLNQQITLPANDQGHSLFANGSFTRAGSGTHAYITSVRLASPVISAGASTITEAATLLIDGAPTAGVANYALHVLAGAINLTGFAVSSAGVVSQPYSANFTWNAKSKSTTYLADCDMILVVSVVENTTTSVIINVKSDTSNPPTTVRARMEIGTGAGYVRSNTITVPIKRNDRYLVEEASLSGSAPTYTINAVPLGTSSTGGA